MNFYIHVPFCAAKCGYCAFYSEAGAASELMVRYVDHLEKELFQVDTSGCETIYIGGGTPTFLPLPLLERLLKLVHSRLCPGKDCEISIEANPETLDPSKVGLLRQYVSRISVGVQSFDPELRSRIGRNCSQEKLLSALKLLREADFPHWNCDLIYSLPGQSIAMWEADLRQAVETGADHISCYSLTPEENSRLGATFMCDDEYELQCYSLAENVLAEYGIARYEISNYSRPGCECRHNVNVWRGGLLRGFGPAAAGFDGLDRMIAVESLSDWLDDAPPERDHISIPARLNEIFAVNLRTVGGWTPDLWSLVPGADSWRNRLEIAENLKKSFPEGLLISPECIKLSPEGLLFWNTIAQELIIYGD